MEGLYITYEVRLTPNPILHPTCPSKPSKGSLLGGSLDLVSLLRNLGSRAKDRGY